MTTDEKIRNIMQAAVEDIRARIASEGENASGRTSASFQVRKVQGWDGRYQIIQYGTRIAPAYTLEKGRAGGRVPAGFGDILAQWSVDKGLSFSSEKERRSFGWALATRIAREGTLRNKRNVIIFDPVMAKANREIKLAMDKSLRGYINAHMRYAVDALRIKGKGIKEAFKGFFNWVD